MIRSSHVVGPRECAACAHEINIIMIIEQRRKTTTLLSQLNIFCFKGDSCGGTLAAAVVMKLRDYADITQPKLQVSSDM